jgi:hypothetical protein
MQSTRHCDDEHCSEDEWRFTEHPQAVRSSSPSFPANIASACQAVNAAQLQPKPQSSEDWRKLEMRRTCNRISARRWRKRKKSKFTDLKNHILALRKEHEELTNENSALQTELRAQLALAQAEAAHLNAIRQNFTESQSLNRLVAGFTQESGSIFSGHHYSGWAQSLGNPLCPTMVPGALAITPGSISYTTPAAFCLQVSRDQLHYDGLQLPVGSVWPTHTSSETSEIGGHVTHGDLTAALRSATAASYSSMRYEL